MAHSLESFLEKLQTEGVEAGRKDAEKIIAAARRDAQRIIAEAKVEAAAIVARAETDAGRRRDRLQTEMNLAVRDAVLKLRATLKRVLMRLLTRNAEEALADPDYLGGLIREVVAAYARADAAGKDRIEINVSEKMANSFKKQAIADLFRRLGIANDRIGLQATLARAGFEYRIDGATVEVSAESVGALLAAMVDPSLEELIDRAAREGESKSSPTEGSDPAPG